MHKNQLLLLKGVAAGKRLQPFSTEVLAASQIHIIGPNGAGKSTLLTRIAGLLNGQGEVWLKGRLLEQIPGRLLARWRGYLCQQQLPGVRMPVFQYLLLHQPDGAGAEALEVTVSLLASRLALTDKLASPLTALSGGEWQRVRLAAILLQVWPTVNPNSCLLLLDEPRNSLDVGQQIALDSLLKQLCKSGRTVITSGHDLNHTLYHADRVWLLVKGEVIAQGDVAEIIEPRRMEEVFGVMFQRVQAGDRQMILVQDSDVT